MTRTTAGAQARRPELLIIVFAAFLLLVGVTAAFQTVLVSAHLSTTALSSVVGTDAALVRTFVNRAMRPSDLQPGAISGARASELETAFADLRARGEILHVELRDLDGTVLVATDPAARGVTAPVGGAFESARDGQPEAALIEAAESSEAAVPDVGSPVVLRTYLPITVDGRVRFVLGLWRDGRPILDQIDQTRSDVVTLTLGASGVAALLMFLIFRSAQDRIARQTTELLEATRRDALTKLLNHGAIVELLGARVEVAKRTNVALGLALVDVDNLGLLNDTHGHAGGDRALLEVARLLVGHLPDGASVGRFGPDEFLVVGPIGSGDVIEPALAAMRAELADSALQFEASERLPITISAGVCESPTHGSSVTELLAVVTTTLGEAKAGGGDAIRVPEHATGERETAAGFDVLQGLVFAIDTKDRYTKRHSEDVARYAAFIGERLGLDPETLRALHLAGLLHDVGKIGIPDAILRTPGRLSAEAFEILKQHVALGDAIVRDVPDVDRIRAGIRHHHERWDGRGYLAGLAGEEIPLIARILAVGDAFSAMTTTRPYRKALSVQVALRRLGDAAGTQLDEQLVETFIRGLETAENPPLPGETRAARLWVPAGAVA